MAAKYVALDIARWFISRNRISVQYDGGDEMSLLKLLKLLYYAEGCALAIKGESLFDEEIIAWEHGPVVESVWREYRTDPYHLPFGSEADMASIEKIQKDDADLLENVFSVFGQYSAWGLRNKTHEEDPWLKASENGTVLNRPIDRNIMKRYFKENYVED